MFWIDIIQEKLQTDLEVDARHHFKKYHIFREDVPAINLLGQQEEIESREKSKIRENEIQNNVINII